MYTTNRTLSRKLLALAMALAMALTMTVSAFASDIRPWYTDKVVITGSVDAATKTYSVTVRSSSDTTQVKMEATLYQKQLIGRQ